jgi:hypothetical protein
MEKLRSIVNEITKQRRELEEDMAKEPKILEDACLDLVKSCERHQEVATKPVEYDLLGLGNRA